MQQRDLYIRLISFRPSVQENINNKVELHKSPTFSFNMSSRSHESGSYIPVAPSKHPFQRHLLTLQLLPLQLLAICGHLYLFFLNGRSAFRTYIQLHNWPCVAHVFQYLSSIQLCVPS
jgi:hypothetical protein